MEKLISVIELDGVKNLLLCGDIYGKFAELIVNLERYEIKEAKKFGEMQKESSVEQILSS